MNIKKLMSDKKLSKKNIRDFLDKKGFFIVLIICVALVGVTTLFVTANTLFAPSIDSELLKELPQENGQASMPSMEERQAVTSSVNTVPEVLDTKAIERKEADKAALIMEQEGPSQINEAKQKLGNTPEGTLKEANNQKFIAPVLGEVTFDYAQDKLLYSRTLEEWRTHSGIDIAADRGTLVKAVADGVVSEIKNDPRLGTMVIVDHQNGLKTVYANLSQEEVVATNQKLMQGDVLGSVGNTAIFESADQAHLHFEVINKGQLTNPNAYLPKIK